MVSARLGPRFASKGERKASRTLALLWQPVS